MERDDKRVVSDILVDMFNDILRVEHRAIESVELMPLSMAELHIIEAVGNDSSFIMSDIARKLRVTLPTLTAAVDRLEEKGYIRRRRLTQDRRRVSVDLTPEGRLAYERHARFHEKMVEAFLSGVDRVKVPELMESMAKLRDFLKQQVELLELDGSREQTEREVF